MHKAVVVDDFPAGFAWDRESRPWRVMEGKHMVGPALTGACISSFWIDRRT